MIGRTSHANKAAMFPSSSSSSSTSSSSSSPLRRPLRVDSSAMEPSHQTQMKRRRPMRTILSALVASLAVICLLATTASAQDREKYRTNELGADAIVPLKTHSFYAPYVESTLQNRYWDFGGDAIVDTNRYIRLTQDGQHQRGNLWSRSAIPAPSFETVFEFRIEGKASINHGDGMAMWLIDGKDRNKLGPVFGGPDHFMGIGIFIDTYSNSRHPYSFPRIMAMQGNGIESYNGAKDGAGQELGACSLDVRKASVATKGRLTFVEGVFLELEIQHNEWDVWESCFKVENVRLPKDPYLGFSALTGDVSDSHDVISISTKQIVFPRRTGQELRMERLKHFPPEDGGKGGKKKGKGGSRGKGAKNKKDKSSKQSDTNSGSSSSSSSSSSSGGGFFRGLFNLIWFFIKWGIVLALLAGLIIVGLRWRKSRDLKRF